jgi:UTP--glucose-1-phosphate uridylyltransferase
MIKKCLFPAAGYGTRFLPATKAVPKEMLPILTKPLLQYAIEEALSAGISNMAIVTGRGKRSIEDHFDNAFELESQLSGSSKEHYLDDIKSVIEKSTFTYVRQRHMLGLGHAILTGEPLIGKEPFAVILADDLCIDDDINLLKKMTEIYDKHKCSVVAIEEIESKDVEKYGVISGYQIDNEIDTYKVTDMIEKPHEADLTSFNANLPNHNIEPTFMGIIGRYILTPDIFNILRNMKSENGSEIQITDALREQAHQGKVIAYKFKGNRFDCGSVKGYIEATNYFAKLQGLL